ncbi:MAG: polysaccharide biosynthesis/export family protein [Pseudomonadota bacterium]
MRMMLQSVLMLGLVMLSAVPALAQSVDYKLGSGDQVRITVFGQEDLSGEFELDGGGAFSMPLIGTVQALSQSPRQLEQIIASKLLDGYLKNPRVSVEVLNYRPFYILGEVNEPGSYPYRAGMTILNAAAMAGGFTYRADEGDIEVSRGGSGEPTVMVPETIVQPGDVIRVNERLF